MKKILTIIISIVAVFSIMGQDRNIAWRKRIFSEQINENTLPKSWQDSAQWIKDHWDMKEIEINFPIRRKSMGKDEAISRMMAYRVALKLKNSAYDTQESKKIRDKSSILKEFRNTGPVTEELVDSWLAVKKNTDYSKPVVYREVMSQARFYFDDYREFLKGMTEDTKPQTREELKRMFNNGNKLVDEVYAIKQYSVAMKEYGNAVREYESIPKEETTKKFEAREKLDSCRKKKNLAAQSVPQNVMSEIHQEASQNQNDDVATANEKATENQLRGKLENLHKTLYLTKEILKEEGCIDCIKSEK